MAKFGELKDPFEEIEYVDIRPIFIPVLTAYKNGITPKRGEILRVTENEKSKLLKQLNGTKPCWKSVKAKSKPVDKKIFENNEEL